MGWGAGGGRVGIQTSWGVGMLLWNTWQKRKDCRAGCFKVEELSSCAHQQVRPSASDQPAR